MNTQRNTVTVVAVVLGVLLVTASWSAFSASANDYEKSIKWGDDLAWSAAGVWIISVPTPAGNILMLHTNHAQDLSGTRYGGVMWEVNGNPTYFGAFPDGEQGNYWATQTLRTGPDVYETAMLGYATKKRAGAPDELVVFSVVNATWKITGPDTKEGQATMATYLASQDADGDGFPDEGQKPISCTPFTFKGRRVRITPGCALGPMPGPVKQ